MHNFDANYLKILSILDIIEGNSSFLVQIGMPKLSDKELIAINLTSEYLGIDGESELFRKFPPKLYPLIERSFIIGEKESYLSFRSKYVENEL